MGEVISVVIALGIMVRNKVWFDIWGSINSWEGLKNEKRF